MHRRVSHVLALFTVSAFHLRPGKSFKLSDFLLSEEALATFRFLFMQTSRNFPHEHMIRTGSEKKNIFAC